MKKLVTLLLFFVVFIVSYAQQSYIYLEPIKGMPCKVLMNQKEVNTVSKNYFIIPISGSGEYVFDIVFGGNQFPKQTFVVDVLEGSAYGYKLAKSSESKFYLLDLINNGKVVETNTSTNLGLTTEFNKIHYFDPTKAIPQTLTRSEERKRNKLEKYKQKYSNDADTFSTSSLSHANKPEYGVIEIITAKKETEQSTKEPIKNFRCSSNTSAQEVSAFTERLNQKNDDELKLILIRKKIFTGCLTCEQVYIMTDALKTQYGRLAAVKLFLGIISDAENLNKLESLFRTESYKSKIREL